jgi:HEAT repeat protein
MVGKQVDIDFQTYLQSILDDEKYHEWHDLYIPLRVEKVKSKGEEEESEQWDVLAGLRKYAPDCVLLTGKPGSGKSTALRQLLWEESQNALAAIERGETNFKIPVLIELRDRKEEEIVNRIQKVLRWARLDVEKIEELLLEGRFLLLFDGLNEIPTSTIWSKVGEFQSERDFRDNPRIFTTRELGAETGLGLKKRLILFPLEEPQMRAFVQNYLPGQAKILLRQLEDRLRELAETPLLLKILCDVVKESPDGKLPTNRGELFRQEFARRYQAFKPKHGCVSDDSRRLTELLLKLLAFEMTQGHSPIDSELQIPRDRAIQILQDFLQTQSETNTLTKASEYLEDLLEWDLLQVASDNTQIEFHHQLFQEYYAAEYLLQILPNLTNEQLKRDYLNYLKWTEPIALMLALINDEAKALEVVMSSLFVDLKLGARLAGEIQSQFQEQAVESVLKRIQVLQGHELTKIQFLGVTRSDAAIPRLRQVVCESDKPYIYNTAIQAIEKIGSACAIQALLEIIKHPDYDVRSRAIESLGNLRSEQAIPSLIKALDDLQNSVRLSSVRALGKIDLPQVIPGLLKSLEDSDSLVREFAARSFADISTLPELHLTFQEQIAEVLVKVVTYQAEIVRQMNDLVSKYAIMALKRLEKSILEKFVPSLLEAAIHPEGVIVIEIVQLLRDIDPESSLPSLLQKVDDSTRRELVPLYELLTKDGKPISDESLLLRMLTRI